MTVSIDRQKSLRADAGVVIEYVPERLPVQQGKPRFEAVKPSRAHQVRSAVSRLLSSARLPSARLPSARLSSGRLSVRLTFRKAGCRQASCRTATAAATATVADRQVPHTRSTALTTAGQSRIVARLVMS